MLTIKAGLTMEVLHWDLLEDVVVWLMDWHNKFHGGLEITILSLLETTAEVEAKWISETMAAGGEHVGCTADSPQCFNWLGKHWPGFYPNPCQWRITKSLMHSLQAAEQFDLCAASSATS